MKVLGLSALGGDSAAALIDDGRIVAAAQEERFTRRKHESGFPIQAIAYCLEAAGCRLDHVDVVAVHGTRRGRTLRALSQAMRQPDGWQGDELTTALAFKRCIKEPLAGMLGQGESAPPIAFVASHRAHAASAFFPSPFRDAAVLSVDGPGAWTTTALGMGTDERLSIIRRQHFPHSLGLLYSAFTHHCGFKVNSGEYKLMGLASYGTPRFARTILDHVIDVADDGWFRLDPTCFDFRTGATRESFAALFGLPARHPDEPLTTWHMDMAASVQAVIEHVLLRLAGTARKETGSRSLCLGGGVALNCVANGKIRRSGLFDRIWIQPAAGEAGGALGAAYSEHYHRSGRRRLADGRTDAMQGAFLGPSFAADDIACRLAAIGARFDVLSDAEVIARTATALAQGKAVGWVQGRMEFGPRALGARSILGDPRSPTMQRALNMKVKYRESFRPFAPSVLADDAPLWFELEGASPYMLMVAPVRAEHRVPLSAENQAKTGLAMLDVPRSTLPAVTHVDQSARVQTVDAGTNPRFHALLSAFKARTGCGVLVNTSFNVRGEPMVCTPEDAFRCFMGNDIEVLVVGDCFLSKDEQDRALMQDYRWAFEAD